MAAKRGAGYRALGNVVTGAPTPSAWMSAPINTMASGRSPCSCNGKIRSRCTRKGKAPVDSAEINPLITAGIRCSAHGSTTPVPCRAGAAAPNSPSRPPRRRSPSATPVPHSPARRARRRKTVQNLWGRRPLVQSAELKKGWESGMAGVAPSYQLCSPPGFWTVRDRLRNLRIGRGRKLCSPVTRLIRRPGNLRAASAA